MSATWMAPTLRDFAPDNDLYPCDACPRRVSADMLVDLWDVPAGRRAAGLRRESVRFVCDACRERAYMLAEMDREQVLQDLGAPVETLSRIGQKQEDQRRRQASRRPRVVERVRPAPGVAERAEEPKAVAPEGEPT